jgi:uncharacterized membrane protein YfcA
MIVDPLLLWAVVGSAMGTILALAGTGGGIVTIPILMIYGGYDIKQASAYGLLALTVGAGLAWVIQRKNTLYPITGVIIFFAGLMAFISAPLKAMSPHWLVSIMLNLTCLFALYSLWFLQTVENGDIILPTSYRIKTAALCGTITGFLSMMTGLGGGVVIIPWLIGITKISFEQAMACSVLSIAVTAPISAWGQGSVDLAYGEWVALIGALLVTSLCIKQLLTWGLPSHMLLVRKITLTAVIIFSMTRTLWDLV